VCIRNYVCRKMSSVNSLSNFCFIQFGRDSTVRVMAEFDVHGAVHRGEWKSRTNRELEELSKGENVVKWIKGQRISWLGHLERMEEDRMPKRSSLKNWKGRDEAEDPGKDGEKK